MQTKQLNIRLDSDQLKELESFAQACEVSTATLAGFFLRAALRASKRIGQIKLPIDFEVCEIQPDAKLPANRLIKKEEILCNKSK